MKPRGGRDKSEGNEGDLQHYGLIDVSTKPQKLPIQAHNPPIPDVSVFGDAGSSTVTHYTMNTFMPAESHEYDSMVFDTPEHKRRATVRTFSGHSFNLSRVRRLSSKRCFLFLSMSCCILSFLIALLFWWWQMIEEPSCPNQDDDLMRQIIAQELENTILLDSVIFSNSSLNCLPESAFAALSQEQLNSLTQITDISFAGQHIKKIHPRAFNVGSFVQVQNLHLSFSDITRLSTGLLRDFRTLRELQVVSDSLEVMNEDIFDGLLSILKIAVSSPVLAEVPRLVKDYLNLRELDITGCENAFLLDKTIFERLDDLQAFTVTDSALAKVGRSDLADELGVDVEVIRGATADFCDSFGISDQRVRRDLAALFDSSITGSDGIFFGFSNSAISCLPKRVFSELSSVQTEFLRGAVLLAFSGAPLRAINLQAFDSDIYAGLERLIIVDTSLPNLPTGVFSSFVGLKFLSLSDNDFVALDDDIISGATSNLEFISMNNMPNLLTFPSFFAEAFNLDVIELRGAGINSLDTDVFRNLNLQELILTNTPLSENFTPEQVALALGIDASVVVL